MQHVQSLNNAWMLIENGIIIEFGTGAPPSLNTENHCIIDAKGKTILPGLIDSHTHIVFAQTREKEFELKIQGKTYEEIAAAGGGILASANHLKNKNESDLINDASKRIDQCIKTGTVAFEIKSGYGLDTENELKMLRVINQLKNKYTIPIKATLLGAHALPTTFKDNRLAFLSELHETLLPKAVNLSLCDYVDIFCETGFFTPSETEELLLHAAKLGIKGKIHGNQLGRSGGVQAAVKGGALSVDHLEHIGVEEIEALKSSPTLPVALPGCSFFLSMPYTPGRQIIDAGLPLVLASDFNPGSCPSGNLLFVWSLACIKMKLSPEEAFNALTINAAAALELNSTLGSITIGKIASFMVFPKDTNLTQIPYHFSMSKPEAMVIHGEWIDN